MAKRKAECPVPMVLRDMPQVIGELKLLEGRNLNCSHPEVKQSKFYKIMMKGVEILDASNLNVSSEVIRLLACIIVNSSAHIASNPSTFKLRVLDFSNNNLFTSGVDISKILSKSTALNTIYLNDTELDRNSHEVTKNLLNIPTLTTLSMKGSSQVWIGSSWDYPEVDNLKPEFSIDTECQAEIKKIVNDHNQKSNSRAQLVNTLKDLQWSQDLVEITGGYFSDYYYENHIKLEL